MCYALVFFVFSFEVFGEVWNMGTWENDLVMDVRDEHPRRGIVLHPPVLTGPNTRHPIRMLVLLEPVHTGKG